MMWFPSSRFAKATPLIARLSASEPPPVNTTLRAVHPSAWATTRRAASTASRAVPPRPWMLDGLPYSSSRNGRIASSTSGSTGVVALWSR